MAIKIIGNLIKVALATDVMGISALENGIIFLESIGNNGIKDRICSEMYPD